MGVLNNIFVLTFIALAATTQGVTLGDKCLYDRECTAMVPNTFCSGKCSCMDGFKTLTDSCVAHVGASCVKDRDCVSLPYSECQKGKCTCQSGYVPHPSKVECLPEAATFGALCKDRLQCITALSDGAACVDGKCSCLPEYRNINNKCVQKKGLNDGCHGPEECYIDDTVAHMIECNNRKCVCKREFVTKGNTCGDRSGLNGACNSDADCFINDNVAHMIECNNRQCVCRREFVTETNTCRDRSGLKGACNSDADCYIGDDVAHMIECNNRQCACKRQFVTASNTCRAPSSRKNAGGKKGVPMVISLASLVICFVLARIVA